MEDLILLFNGPISFLFGVMAGLAVYRLLWRVETTTLRVDLNRQEAYNEALQHQVVKMENQVGDLNQRIRILEESNNELMRENRQARMKQ